MPIKRTVFYLTLLWPAAMALFSGSALCREQGTIIDPEADKILRQMSDYMNTLQQFTIHLENNTDMLLKTGHKVQVGSAVDVSVRRPDRLRADVSGDIRSQQFFYDGKSITLYDRKVHYYATMKAPSNIEEALNHARENVDLSAPAADLVSMNSYDVLTESVTSGNYIGLSKVHGVECHHLLFTKDDVDWQIWIENSKTPLPRKLVITEKWMAGGPQFTSLFLDWNLSAQLEDNLFTFVPPDKAEKIKFLPAE
jgi:hypothetical protein